MLNHIITAVVIATALFSLSGCGPAAALSPSDKPPPLAEELVFYDWSNDSIAEVFEAFTQEYGVKIRYVSYEYQEDAVANMRANQVYDIVVLENQFIPALINEGLLAEIDYQNVPNFKNISANFRDLAHDPKNKHTIPYSWGTTGLVVRSDLVAEPITSWSDMWDPRYAGQVALWETTPRYILGAALKSLGYSVNSEEPAELEAALSRLQAFKENVIWLNDEWHSTAPLLVKGEAVMALGWSEDVWLAQEETEAISYVLPKEGAILWGDNFVIPANSPNKYTAELFLNFILRPEISAQIVNGNYYPMANDAANAYIQPEILADPVIFPPNQALKNSELLLPLSAAGEKLYADIWDRFLAADKLTNQ